MGQVLFPREGPNVIALQAIRNVSVALFLLVAGMEVDLSTIFRLKHTALLVALGSLLFPFALGWGAGTIAPQFFGMVEAAHPTIFALFLGIALAVCALPVIIKILMDLNLFRSDLGMIVVAVAVFIDLVGWIGFAVILGLLNSGSGSGHSGIAVTIVGTLALAGAALTVGRWLVDRALPWVQAHTSWPGGVLGFAMTLGLLGAAATEAIGTHAIFGAFLVGVVVGDSRHLQQRTRVIMDQFIAAVFAPLFFASIGLRMDFAARFDVLLVAVLLVIACVGGTLGSVAGARLARLPARQAWAVGFALNARGAMSIVLAVLALQNNLISERLFVALVVMAIVTSIIAGPLMQRVLQRKRAVHFRDYLVQRAFIPALRGATGEAVIRELSAALAPAVNQAARSIGDAVWSREQTMSTALPGGLAVPHARIEGLEKPAIAVGISQVGAAFDAVDNAPTQLVLMVLTPTDSDQIQLEILADVARTFIRPDTIDRAVACDNYTQFLALLNMAKSSAHHDVPAVQPAAPVT
jgi:Kef-type K+ transport system membrane component KefB/mannitol/fructose-specific phosphotransferase system IIA component (Ntr-type)